MSLLLSFKPVFNAEDQSTAVHEDYLHKTKSILDQPHKHFTVKSLSAGFLTRLTAELKEPQERFTSWSSDDFNEKFCLYFSLICAYMIL